MAVMDGDRAAEAERLREINRLLRSRILLQVNAARSGHTTSSLSSVELMSSLFFGGSFRQDLTNLDNPSNDRVLFSKGHASPLLYAIYSVLGVLSEEELTGFRSVDSPLEGHPTNRFPFVEVPTGSLGQGLSVGLGLAYAAKYFDRTDARIYVLLGDGEFAEGQVWEALSVAAHYNVNNLVGILDMNRLGQTGETQYGWDGDMYAERVSAFGWAVHVLDGHDPLAIVDAYARATENRVPTLIVGKTVKGKGVPFWEDLNGWHSQPIPEDRYSDSVARLQPLNHSLQVNLPLPAPPAEGGEEAPNVPVAPPQYEARNLVPTKKAFGDALIRLGPSFPELLIMDGDVQNSTHTIDFARSFPDRFIQGFIAEQNLVGMAQGLGRRVRTPFVVTFGAFLTRAFDQLRMVALSEQKFLVSGSYTGASIGKDGPSNMGLEDIAMFRSLQGSTVLCPADAMSTERLTELMLTSVQGIGYLRTTREPVPVIYSSETEFRVGGSHVLRSTESDQLTFVATGITVHEALRAHDLLLGRGLPTRVIDCYSIKPIDVETLRSAARDTGRVLVVEDHWAEGGLGEAVLAALADEDDVAVRHRAVTTTPVSGDPRDVMELVGIDATSIAQAAASWLLA